MRIPRPFLACLIAAALLCLFSVWVHMLIGFNNDHMLFMDQTRKLLAGGRPYVDYVDVNPPLIHLVYSIPYFIAAHTGFRLDNTLYVMVILFACFSLFASDRILRASAASITFRLATGVVLAITYLSLSFFHNIFADREHLIIIAIVPFLLLYSPLANREAVPLRWRIGVSVMAGLGFAMKLYFYAFYAVALLSRIITKRSVVAVAREPEHYIIAGIAVTYLAVIYLFFPEYPHTIVPLAMKTYAQIGRTPRRKILMLVGQLIPRYALPGVLASIGVWYVKRRNVDRVLFYAGALMAASLACYYINSGWGYTLYQCVATGMVFYALASGLLISSLAVRKWIKAAVAIALLGVGLFCYAAPVTYDAMIAIARQQVHGSMGVPYVSKKLQEKFDMHFAQHPKFMAFSVSMWSANLMENHPERENVGRFDYLWPLPGIMALEKGFKNAQDYKALSAWISEGMADDLDNHKPDMVLSDRSNYQRGLEGSGDSLDFFKRNTRFAEAFSHYELADSFNFCGKSGHTMCAFDVYYRKSQ